MSAAPKFPWPLPDQKSDPKAELRSVLPSAPFTATAVPKNEILDNQESTRRFRQAERLESVGRLAGGVAHDFNNLLTGVLLYCDLILALQPDDRVRGYAEEIRNTGVQASGLVQQLLALARPTNCDPCLLSLNEIAEGMRNLLVRLIGENIELQFRLDPDLGMVRMDPTQARQILLNLALNARDAMPAGGQITVETGNCRLLLLTEPSREPSIEQSREQGLPANRSCVGATSLPCVLFAVQDNGSGMDAPTRARLFEAFFTTKPAGEGTGLGLATVRDIVTSNGGLIHVESAPARGTRVTVLLPLVPEAAQNSQRASEPVRNEGELPVREKE